MPGPPRSCNCGECRLCKHRSAGARFYQKNAAAVKLRNAEYKRQRQAQRRAMGLSPEVPDEELDRKAMAWL
jgi:hypothetical protein